jgi:hypothetical protein
MVEYLASAPFPLKVYCEVTPYIKPVAGCEPITGIIIKKLLFDGFTTSKESFFLNSSGKDFTGHFTVSISEVFCATILP